jgi:hypothetical protein
LVGDDWQCALPLLRTRVGCGGDFAIELRVVIMTTRSGSFRSLGSDGFWPLK